MYDLKTSAQLGFGGGCHWCTEAVFDHLKGVHVVRQGWIKSVPPQDTFSEAVLVDFDPRVISIEILVQIHLLTHSSTSNHRMREKYRSAIYFVDEGDEAHLKQILQQAKEQEAREYLTKVLPLVDFQLNEEAFLDYYKKRPEAPFCRRHIEPKLRLLMKRFGEKVKDSQVESSVR